MCVPIDPQRCDDFDPTKVPTITDLVNELNEYERRHPAGSGPASSAGAGAEDDDDIVDSTGARRIAGTLPTKREGGRGQRRVRASAIQGGRRVRWSAIQGGRRVRGSAIQGGRRVS